MKGVPFKVICAGATLLLPLIPASGQTTEETTREKILSAGQEWQEKYDRYEPASDMIDALKSRFGAGGRVDVYFGLWCSDSRNNVPPFIKIVDLVGPGPAVRYFDVPRKAGKDVKYFIDDLKVDRLPTFIFYRNDEEIGRIVENPTTSLIEDMMNIVFR